MLKAASSGLIMLTTSTGKRLAVNTRLLQQTRMASSIFMGRYPMMQFAKKTNPDG